MDRDLARWAGTTRLKQSSDAPETVPFRSWAEPQLTGRGGNRVGARGLLNSDLIEGVLWLGDGHAHVDVEGDGG